MKKSKLKNIIGIIIYIFIMSSVSITFIIFGIHNISSIQTKINNGDYIKTEATISKVEYESPYSQNVDNVYIDFFTDKKEYKNIKFNITMPGMKIGDKHYIYYNKNNPTEILTKSDLYLGLPFLIPGIIVLIIMLISIKKEYQNHKKQNNLIENGKQIYVEVLSIIFNRKTGSMQARCKYIDENNNIYIMLSEPTYHDLNNYFHNMDKNLLLKAYVDRENIRNYYIPVEILFGEKLQ